MIYPNRQIEKRKSALNARPLWRSGAKALSVALFGITLAGAQTQHEDKGGAAGTNNSTFSSIKALAGEWDGTFEWIGTTRKGQMNARYYLTGNGSAVVEDLISGGIPDMTTVYHLNGTELRATHYCAAGNQPRLKAVSPNGKTDPVNFEMIDITNLAKPEAGHVKGLELNLATPNEVTIRFTFTAAGKEAVEEIKLKRKSNSAG